MDFLKNKGKIVLVEGIPRQVFAVMDMDKFYNLFRSEKQSTNDSLYGSDITRLMHLFWKAKAKLVQYDEEELAFDPELVIETRLIHLCEYALERGYRIRLSE